MSGPSHNSAMVQCEVKSGKVKHEIMQLLYDFSADSI